MASPLPLTVIGGFLGAGKTTLLLRWLQQAQGRRIAVLVNDFGALNIDAALVAQAGGDAIALHNGCVCCAIGDDLSQALGRVLDAQPPFDAVVVEASGVSDPWRIAQVALVDRALSLAGVLLLVDSAALASQLADPLLTDTLTRPLAHADLVLLNKADAAGDAALAAARAWMARHADAVPVLATVQAALPAGLDEAWLDGGQVHAHRGDGTLAGPPAPTCNTHAPDTRPATIPLRPANHGAQFDHWSLQPLGLFDAARLRGWLQTLPAGVLRLKGLLPVAAAEDRAAPVWMTLQFAGRQAQMRRATGAPAGGAALLAIGLAGQLPMQVLHDGLADCRAKESACAPPPPPESPTR